MSELSDDQIWPEWQIIVDPDCGHPPFTSWHNDVLQAIVCPTCLWEANIDDPRFDTSRISWIGLGEDIVDPDLSRELTKADVMWPPLGKGI